MTRSCRSRIRLAAAIAAVVVGPAGAAEPGAIAPLSPEMRAAMTGKSWQEDCPVGLDDLAAVTVAYVDFAGAEQIGVVVIHKQLAADIADIFGQLHAAGFPMAVVAPWEEYGPDVYAEKNVTTGFYCEKAQDDPGEWSSHAYGYAVDINPLLNPFRDPKEGWWPAGAGGEAARDGAPGKIAAGSTAFDILAEHGWAWGGFEEPDVDYMHFIKVAYGADVGYPDRPYAATRLEYRPKD